LEFDLVRDDSVLRKALKAVRELCGPVFWPTLSFAQEGEDLVLKRLFDVRKTGFYVEVGCHHPFRFSNTYLFYRRGWRGICIDPLPGTVRRFNRWRPRDIAVELGVTFQPSTLTYFMFNEPAVNTFDPNIAGKMEAQGIYKIVERRKIQTEPLSRIIERYLPSSVERIDFLSVDVEGLDVEVLRSNDWQRFSPEVVIAECLNSDLFFVQDNSAVRFMGDVGYRPYAKTGHSVVFVRA
jgi:FkbM family methyltransferase